MEGLSSNIRDTQCVRLGVEDLVQETKQLS